jgi:DNA-binding NarL/FixJ family response regulator
MTKLLFLPNETTFLLLDSSMPPDALINVVETGRWVPPQPYDALTEAERRSVILQAVRQGDMVVVTTSFPLDMVDGRVRIRPTQAGRHGSLLTERQTAMLQYLADGFTTKQIALLLGLHPRTVMQHILALKNRLGTETRAQLVKRAAELGLCRK